MKQTSNAIKFLLAQYRSIFKNAYFKGLATAVLVTAGLAAGAGQAQAAHDGIFYETTDKTGFTPHSAPVASEFIVIGVGGYENDTKSSDTAQDGKLDGATLSFGGSGDDVVRGTTKGAYAGYVSLSGSASNAVANGNELQINGVVTFGDPNANAHAVGGWAVHKGNGTATAQGNKVHINANAANATTKGNATINGQIIGAWASSLNGASALGNTVEVLGSAADSKMALQDSVFGGLAAAEKNSVSGTYRTQNNELTISNASLTSGGGGKMIIGGYVNSLAVAVNTGTVSDFNATGNTVTLTNVDVAGTSAANKSNIVAANLADGNNQYLTITSVAANGIEGQTGLTINGGSFTYTDILGGRASISGNSTTATANFNSVALNTGVSMSSGGAYGARIIASGDELTLTGSNNTLSLAANTEETVENHTNVQVFGTHITGTMGTTGSGSTITANNNKVSLGAYNTFALDANSSGSTIAGAFINTTESGSTITANNNTVEVFGDVVGYKDGDVKAGIIAGAMVLEHGAVTMKDNSVTVGGNVSNGLVVGAYSTSDNLDAVNKRFVPVMTGNSVTLTADAELIGTDIYASYSKADTKDSTALITNNDVTVSGTVRNGHIYGGMGADSVITLDSQSKYVASDSTVSTPYKIQSDVVNVAGELRINNNAAVTIKGYSANGSLGSDEVNTNSTTIANTAKVFNYGTLTLRGETDVADGATLVALNSRANIIVDASTTKTEIDTTDAVDPDLPYDLTGGKAALIISDEMLSSYLQGGKSVTIDDVATDTTQGSVQVTKLGAVDFRDSVVLSDFDFANSQTPGKIQIDTVYDATSGSIFRADTVTVAHKLAQNATTAETHDELVDVDAGGVAIEADTLNLGSANLTSAQSQQIQFYQATVSDQINFIAKTSGVDDDGNKNIGYILSGSDVKGSNYTITNAADSNNQYYTTNNIGDINGPVKVVSDGKLGVQNGDWQAHNTITLAGTGKLYVNVDPYLDPLPTNAIPQYSRPDSTLKLDSALQIEMAGSNATKVSVSGNGFYNYEEALDTLGDDGLALLDLTNGITLVDDSGDAIEFTDGYTLSGTTTISATAGGVLLLDGSNVGSLLSANDYAGSDTTGVLLQATNGGSLVFRGEHGTLTTGFNDFTSTVGNNGIYLGSGGSAGNLVVDTLTISEQYPGHNATQELSTKYVNFGGNVYVGDLAISDERRDANGSTIGAAGIANGNVYVFNSLSSFNNTLHLGFADNENGSAVLNLVTPYVGDEGSVSATNVQLNNVSQVNVLNGVWTANSTFALQDTSKMSVGDNVPSFHQGEDFNGNEFVASLEATGISMTEGTELTVFSNGSATFGTADFTSLAAADSTDAASVKVYGSLTINDVARTTGTNDSVTYADLGKSGSILIGKNGKLTFGSAAVEHAILSGASSSQITYTTAEDINNALDAGFGKIANQGGMLTLSLGDGVVFDREAINTLKHALFTTGSFSDGGAVLAEGGILNIGLAHFKGYQVQETTIGGVAGYTATWDSLKSFSDIYSPDTTNEYFTHTNVTGIAVDDEVKGHWGSLSMAAGVSANAQVRIEGDTSLSFASGNNGNFISTSDHNTTLGAIINSGKSLTLNNGGKIGKVTFEANTDVGDVGYNEANTQDAILVVSEQGKTVIDSIESRAVGNGDVLITNGADAEVTNDITNIGDLEAITSSLAVNGNASANYVGVEGASISVAKTLTTSEVGVVGGSLTAKDFVFTRATEEDVAIVGEGKMSVETFKVNDNARSGAILVGLDGTTLATEDVPEGTTGTGYLEVTDYMSLNGSTLVVDPDYGQKTSIASVNHFKNSENEDFTYNRAGTIYGSVQVGANAALGIGSANIAEVAQAIAQYQENGSLKVDANNSQTYGSILYLNGHITLTENSEIALNSAEGDGDIRSSLLYSVSDATSGGVVTHQYADLGLGANTAILMTEAAFDNEAGDRQGVAITFDKQNANVAGNGGEIVLVGAYDSSKSLNFFNDKDNNGVNVKGEIIVRSQNGFLWTKLHGDNVGMNVDLEVNEPEARRIMNAASEPVLNTLIAYGNRSAAQAPTDPVTPPSDNSGNDNTNNSGNGGYVDVIGGGNNNNSQDTVAWEILTPATGNTQDPQEPQAPVTTSTNYSQFLEEVIWTSNGAPAEAVARMALYGGAVQAAIAANTSSYEAIAARTGVGATDMGLTVANNGMGAALWLAPMYKNQDSDSFDAEGLSYGVDMNLYGVALGADFEFMPGLTAGIMFNVGSGSADGQGNAAASSVSNDFDYYGISVYGNYKYDALSITADLGYTAVDSDIDAHTGLESYGTVSTSVDSTAWTLGVTGKYTFNVGGVELAPHAGLRYSSIDLDDYSVSDIASYDADTMDIFSIPVGVTIAKEFQGESWSVKPSLDLSVQGNFGDDTSDGTVHWTGVDGLATNVSSEMMDNFTYGATLGVSAQTGSFSMGLGVNYTGSDNVDEFGVNANARFVF